MKITISHVKDPAIAWDINVSVDAGKSETIAYVEVRINDFPEVRENVDPPLDSWEQGLKQKGVYPGDNKVQVLVRDAKGKETRKQQKWS